MFSSQFWVGADYWLLIIPLFSFSVFIHLFFRIFSDSLHWFIQLFRYLLIYIYLFMWKQLCSWFSCYSFSMFNFFLLGQSLHHSRWLTFRLSSIVWILIAFIGRTFVSKIKALAQQNERLILEGKFSDQISQYFRR